jgi:hypothetical protein
MEMKTGMMGEHVQEHHQWRLLLLYQMDKRQETRDKRRVCIIIIIHEEDYVDASLPDG